MSFRMKLSAVWAIFTYPNVNKVVVHFQHSESVHNQSRIFWGNP